MRAAQPVRFTDSEQPGLLLSTEEKVEVAKKAEALDKLLSKDNLHAKYKIEVLFGKARSSRNPTPGVLCFWASGAKLHGGGDDKLYLCPHCSHLISAMCNSSSGAVCAGCGKVVPPAELVGELLLNLSMRKWAEVLTKYFHLCDRNCDIYAKHAPNDLRAVAKAQSESKATWQNSKKLESARAKRVQYIYPLRNLIKDLNAGADLTNRLYAFLTA